MTDKLMISTSTNYHWVNRVSAHAGIEGTIILKFHGSPDVLANQFNEADICLFLNDASLAARLIAAINGAAQPEQEVAA